MGSRTRKRRQLFHLIFLGGPNRQKVESASLKYYRRRGILINYIYTYMITNCEGIMNFLFTLNRNKCCFPQHIRFHFTQDIFNVLNLRMTPIYLPHLIYILLSDHRVSFVFFTVWQYKICHSAINCPRWEHLNLYFWESSTASLLPLLLHDILALVLGQVSYHCSDVNILSCKQYYP